MEVRITGTGCSGIRIRRWAMVGYMASEIESGTAGGHRSSPGAHPRRWKKAILSLGYAPRDRRECDDAFWEGMASIRSSSSLAARVDGAELVLGAWCDRSLALAIEGGYWREHPGRDRIAAMLDLRRVIPGEVVNAL